ncbi:hypothetical protein EV191_11219 [Tamaricihabitans halophyticus]|uniref:GH16 domain-containing protein n=1 Tax=Tamaricihabitans halophyticus TaxID=1262583 RepID=A0A4R2QJR4_9PSEU|nr:DUF6772 family protein [Tamaricihabitans halophyticus]TCP47225.1 hypothetical protein EV191_11219 [Tamaricihabitans halophyticus]
MATNNDRVAADEFRRAALLANPELSRFNPLPRILAYDQFETGTHGWTELIGNHDGYSNLDTVDDHMRDFRPPQLSSCTFFDVGTHGAMSGNYALKVATRPIAGHTGVAIRRLTMSGRGLVQFETYFTYKAEAGSAENQVWEQAGAGEWDGNIHPSEQQFGAFTVATDICDPGGLRYHCVARYQNTDLNNEFTRRWIYPVVPEPTPREHLEGKAKLSYTDDFTAPDPADWRTFGEPQAFCYNEVPTKVNWHYLRWQIDTSLRRNVELQVNDQIFDMRDIPVPPYAETYDSLDNLLNFYVSTRTHSNVRNFLYLDSVLISVDW